MALTTKFLFCLVCVLAPTALHAGNGGGDTCKLSTKCPTITNAQGQTDANCTEVKYDLACLVGVKRDSDCAHDSYQQDIEARINATTEYNTSNCGAHSNATGNSDQRDTQATNSSTTTERNNTDTGVAGLAASSVVCIIVCVISFFVKG